MNQRLKDAAEQGDLDSFYALIGEDPYLLKNMEEIPFSDTPLHIAASVGNTRFALEIMRLMPSFSRKPNRDGYCPLHLALQNKHTQMTLRFVQVDPSLVRVKGREGLTPLHWAAGEGCVDILTQFLSACPESLEDLTVQSETALHVALKNGKVEAFKILVGWLQLGFHVQGEVLDMKEKVLNWKDDEGNTLLHIAASSGQLEVMKLLIEHEVDTKAQNFAGSTSLQILQSQMPLSNNQEITIDVLHSVGASKSTLMLPPSIITIVKNHLISKEISLFEQLLSFIKEKIQEKP
ncbi:ankyrin repeat-containing protein BDA1-like [Malania oleifera]|uniref:ankyrin repeat-containing protein BDA1-like n=1 Tax=Malania oleifera TaxID=397392 RepID=UPI0025AEA20D|nr:ankyrin repeat-containing protein BDA1-like [Malania oleifera]